MEVGLIHLHKSLAHLLVLFALVGVILALAGAGKKVGLAKAMHKTHKLGIMMLGRLIYVAGWGAALVVGHPIMQAWILAGVVLWGVVEVAGKRLVNAELNAVLDGGVASPKLIVGSLVQLVVIVGVYGAMQMRIAF